jgi:3-carboxy-cis,cis-muconate cycloisomerase
MSFSPADSKIFSPLFSDPEVEPIWPDEVFVREMLEVEAALATVQGELGIIPVGAAEKIGTAAAEFEIDYSAMQTGIEIAGVPVIELVRQLRNKVGEGAADFVHWGATTQDIMDTARVMQISSRYSCGERLVHRLNALLNAGTLEKPSKKATSLIASLRDPR